MDSRLRGNDPVLPKNSGVISAQAGIPMGLTKSQRNFFVFTDDRE
jgi:hypothetical protein